MNKELKSLTWKYFWQQKFTEVGLFLLILTAIIFIPYLLGNNIGNNAVCVSSYSNVWYDGQLEQWDIEVSSDECQNRYGHLEYFGSIAQWFEGLIYVLCAIIALASSAFVVYVPYKLIKDWLISNWERAERRAKEKIRGKK